MACPDERSALPKLNQTSCYAGFEHSVETVTADLLTCLDNPALALMQWHEVFSVAEVRPVLACSATLILSPKACARLILSGLAVLFAIVKTDQQSVTSTFKASDLPLGLHQVASNI